MLSSNWKSGHNDRIAVLALSGGDAPLSLGRYERHECRQSVK